MSKFLRDDMIIKKQMVCILLYLLYSISNFAFAEDRIDSLLNALKNNQNDVEKMKTYSELSSEMYRRNADSGLVFGEKALALNKNYDNKKIQARTLYGIAWNYIVKSDYSKSLSYLYRALNIYETLTDSVGIAQSLNSIGVAFASNGDFEKGIHYTSQALDVSTKLNLKTQMVKALSNLGEMNLILKRVTKANEYYNKAIVINKSVGDQGITMNLYTGLGNAYSQNNEYDKAIYYYKQASALSKVLRRSINEGYISMQIANVYYHSMLDSGVIQRSKFMSKSKHENLLTAIEYLNYAKNIFVKQQSVYEIKEVYGDLYTMYKAIGKSDSALYYFELATVMNDSAKVLETANKMAKMESDKEIKSRDARLEIAKLNESSSRRLSIIFAIIAISVAMALIWSAAVLKNRKKMLIILNEKNTTISQANIELDNLSKHLQETNATKDKFFSIIAHDLKSPFSGFINLTKFMSESIEEFSKIELVMSAKSLNKSATGLYKLLENLLEWSKIQRGITEFRPTEISAGELVEDNLMVLQDFATNKDINLINCIDKNIIIIVDYQMMNTLFRNLISNAIKFTQRHGRVEIEYQNSDEQHIFLVKDTGIGMSPEIIEKLFKIDQKVSNEGTEGESSTGLGLLLCKEFVERHNGKIWVESQVNSGSTFYFSIPKLQKIIET